MINLVLCWAPADNVARELSLYLIAQTMAYFERISSFDCWRYVFDKISELAAVSRLNSHVGESVVIESDRVSRPHMKHIVGGLACNNYNVVAAHGIDRNRRLKCIMPQHFTFNRSLIVSENPMTYMAAATAFARAKMMPIEPPNSGPRLREIM